MNVVFIGAGRAGTSIAKVLQQSNKFKVRAITTTKIEEAQKSANFINNIDYVGTDNNKAVKFGEIVFITTPDDIIEKVCNSIVKNSEVEGKVFFHVSGSRPSTILKKAKERGAYIGSIHPLQSLPSFYEGVENIRKAYFCIEGDSEAIKIGKQIVSLISGKYFTIDTNLKPLYHAAAVFSSNFLNTTCFVAYLIFKKLGIDENLILEILQPIIEGTVNNIKKLGVIDSLTGPVSRGDKNTIKKHLETFLKYDSSNFDIYKELTKKTVELALMQKGQNNIENILEIKKLLSEL